MNSSLKENPQAPGNTGAPHPSLPFLVSLWLLPAQIEFNLNFCTAANAPLRFGILIIDRNDFLGLSHLLN